MSDLMNFERQGAQPQFDAIRRTRPDGTEYWSGRDYMAPLGYGADWRNFASVIEKAKIAAANQGYRVDDHFGGVTENAGQQGGRPREDFHLSRFACYLVAMNGDPRKPEVAAAQAYFAVRTREAETRPVIDADSITRLEIAQMLVNAETERLALEAKNAELEPKAEAFDSFLDATGKYAVGAVAQMLGTSQNKLFRDLRNDGVFIPSGSRRNTPYQKYAKYFEVIPHEYERSNGEMGCSYTTYVQPAGIDFIRRRLGLSRIDPQMPAVGSKVGVES